jgi:hypothetical protein
MEKSNRRAGSGDQSLEPRGSGSKTVTLDLTSVRRYQGPGPGADRQGVLGSMAACATFRLDRPKPQTSILALLCAVPAYRSRSGGTRVVGKLSARARRINEPPRRAQNGQSGGVGDCAQQEHDHPWQEGGDSEAWIAWKGCIPNEKPGSASERQHAQAPLEEWHAQEPTREIGSDTVQQDNQAGGCR